MPDGARKTALLSPALVTGASGFIGSHLVRRLVAEGCDVVGIDIDTAQRPTPDGATIETVDIRDTDGVRRVISETQPRAVYHLAAQASVAVSMRDPVADIEANVLGTVNLAQAAIKSDVRRVVFFSTGGALYGEPKHMPVSEDAPPQPESVYGASKLAAERYLRLLCDAASVDLSILRPANIYGPGQDPHGEAGVIAIFAARMLAGESATIFGDGKQRRDYIYIDDALDAALLSVVGEPATCLIGSGIGTSTREIFDLVAAASGYEREPIFAPERPGDIQRIALDASRAADVWGWRPSTALADGLAATVDSFRA
jgi:UDP-glucose 4-epimerase